MDKAALLHKLDWAEDLVERSDRLIDRHSRLIFDLHRRGVRSATAWQLLEVYMRSQTLQMQYRDRIRHDLCDELVRGPPGLV
jgi:hypothetical protein